MFNPLTPAEMVVAIGRAARAAAGTDGLLAPFERGQLMSAYSATRHLAVELDAFGPQLRVAADELVAAVERTLAQLGDDPAADALERFARGLTTATDGPAVGELAADLLAVCREREELALARLRGQVRVCLKALCDREVALLAAAIEAGRR